MGLFEKLFGGERREAPQKKETPRGPEKEKSIADWSRKIDTLEGKIREIKIQFDTEKRKDEELRKQSVASGPFSERIKAITELKINLSALMAEAKAIKEGLDDWVKEQKLSGTKYPSELFTRLENITSRFGKQRESSLEYMEDYARGFLSHARNAQEVYDLYQKGEIREKIEEEVIVSPEKIREGGGEWIPAKRKIVERTRIIKKAPQGWENIDDAIKHYIYGEWRP